jgi:4-carboxy-3-alkylbut-2-enoyl-[acp] decarboxylase
MTEPAVHLQEIEPGIVQVTMQDRVHKNTFSEELIYGLLQSFQKIRD